MDLLAPILAYAGAVAGIVVATVVSYNSLFDKPGYAPLPAQATAVAARSHAAKTAKSRGKGRAESGHAPVHGATADDAGSPHRLHWERQRSRHPAIERPQRRLAHRPSAPRAWAYRPPPRAPYAFGSAEGQRGRFGGDY